MRNKPAPAFKHGSKVYATEDIHAAGELIVHSGAEGRVVSGGGLALNVKFREHKHIVLCLRNMVTATPPIVEDFVETDEWVKRVNEACRAADAAFAEVLYTSPVVHLALQEPDVQRLADRFVKIASNGKFNRISDVFAEPCSYELRQLSLFDDFDATAPPASRTEASIET